VDDTEFTQAAAGLGVELEGRQLDLCRIYERQLQKWAARVRLVSRRDRARIRQRHLLDCMAAAPHLPGPANPLLDLGSGAGLPGIPLKIVRPDLQVVLLEPARMKVLFLRSVLEELGLAGLEVVRDRAEILASHPSWRGRFRLVTCRAVGPLPAVWALALPLLHPEGTLVAFKGPDAIREFEGFPTEGIDIVRREYCLPVSGGNRALFLLKERPLTQSEAER